MESHWVGLGACDPKALVEARLQCHHAVQLLTHAARGYIPARDDDSHTNLGWQAGALVGRRVERGASPFQLALQVADLTLLCLDADGRTEAEFEMDGHTWQDAADWVRNLLRGRELPAEPFGQPLHFQIAPHPVTQGGRFSAAGHQTALAELARYFANGFQALEATAAKGAQASEVRCWPHHFDTGLLIGQSIGLGLSPGDGSYSQPYIYANPYPNPDPASLPPLASGGHWHTEGWLGAVATAEDILRQGGAEHQEAWTLRFLDEAVATLKTLTKA